MRVVDDFEPQELQTAKKNAMEFLSGGEQKDAAFSNEDYKKLESLMQHEIEKTVSSPIEHLGNDEVGNAFKFFYKKDCSDTELVVYVERIEDTPIFNITAKETENPKYGWMDFEQEREFQLTDSNQFSKNLASVLNAMATNLEVFRFAVEDRMVTVEPISPNEAEVSVYSSIDVNDEFYTFNYKLGDLATLANELGSDLDIQAFHSSRGRLIAAEQLVEILSSYDYKTVVDALILYEKNDLFCDDNGDLLDITPEQKEQLLKNFSDAVLNKNNSSILGDEYLEDELYSVKEDTLEQFESQKLAATHDASETASTVRKNKH